MDDEIFISLSEKIEHLINYFGEDNKYLLRDILSQLFQYDNYPEILSNLLKLTSIMS